MLWKYATAKTKEAEMEILISSVISFILGIGIVSGFIKKYYTPTKEIFDVGMAIVKALKDGKITPEEVEEIVSEAKDVKEVISKL